MDNFYHSIQHRFLLGFVFLLFGFQLGASQTMRTMPQEKRNNTLRAVNFILVAAIIVHLGLYGRAKKWF